MANKLEGLLNKMNACKEARDWVNQAQITTFEQAWAQCQEPAWLLAAMHALAYKEESTRRARKWVHQCLLRVFGHLHDPRSLQAMSVLETYASGGSSDGELADASVAAEAALATRIKADADAKRVSPDFHAARAVVASLAWPDQQWDKRATEASVLAAMAVAQQASGVDHDALVIERSKQTDLLRTVFAPDIAGIIASAENLG
jgi:hypothetical protein